MDSREVRKRLLALEPELVGGPVDSGTARRVLGGVAAGMAYDSPALVLDALAWLIEFGVARDLSRPALEAILSRLRSRTAPPASIARAFDQAEEVLARMTGPVRLKRGGRFFPRRNVT